MMNYDKENVRLPKFNIEFREAEQSRIDLLDKKINNKWSTVTSITWVLIEIELTFF